MSSIIEGYSYDIFISYRLRDNKGEKWVSEFVEALRTELETTFKEDISIYFDENPHDGLLETHDVDASLREKLNCLIFIPVISRIYCDPKAFAWVHEFKAFVDLASADKFGMKVNLLNGNVSTRVLPVRIHELDREDTLLCETLLGSVMRGVDFIYKSPGVNRPLRANEDHPRDNLNKTYYRDQINKVANAIRETLSGLKADRTQAGKNEPGISKAEKSALGVIGDRIRKIIQWQRFKKEIISLLAFIIILSGGYLLYRKIYLNNNEKSIAINLKDTANDSLLSEAAAEFKIILNQKLALVKSINMLPGFQTDRFFETEKSTVNIRKGLNANYFLSGTLRRKNKEITIWVEFSETNDNKVLWNKPIPWTSEKMAKNISGIVRMIAEKMNVKLTPDEEKQIDTEISVNPDVNLKYLSANKDLNDAWYYYNYGNKFLDSASFSKAIISYDKIIREKPTALAYAKRAIARSWGYYLEQLDSSNISKCRDDIEKALALDSTLSETDIAQGFYYYYCMEQNEKALEFFERASLKEPDNYKPIFYMILAQRRRGNWEDCRRLLHEVTNLYPTEALFLTNIGMTYLFLHNYDSAIIFNQKAIEMMPNWDASYINKFDAMTSKSGVIPEARSLIDEAVKKTGSGLVKGSILLNMYSGNYSEALKLTESSDMKDFELAGEKYIIMARIYRALDNQAEELKCSESARLIISQAVKNRPDYCFNHSMLALAYAGLGNKARAIEEAETAVRITHSKNKVDESEAMMYLAQVYVMLGQFNEACPIVLYLLNNPSYLSKKLLEVDPVWKPLLARAEYRKKLL